jgi:chaperone modulatory protein CbpM
MTEAVEHLQGGEQELLPADDFERTSGLTGGEVRELVEYGLLKPQQRDLETALSLREARQQGKDFDFDLFTIGLVAGYLRRIEQLQIEVRQLRAERPARTIYSEVSFTSIEVRKA